MRNVSVVGAIVGVLLLLVLVFTGCETIEPGYVGIKVNMFGENRGTEDYPLRTGRVFYNRITHDVFVFPTFTQRAIWTRDATEGSPNNDEITVNSSEAATISFDVALAFSIKAEMVPHIFTTLRKPAEYITQTYMRDKVRDAMNRFAGKYKAVELMGAERTKFVEEVLAWLKTELEPSGILVESVSVVGAPRADERVVQAINSTIEAQQRSIEAENKVRQSEAEAEQRIAEARGEAESLTLVAEAKAKANQILTESLSDRLLLYEALQQWDGKMPLVLDGQQLIVSLNSLKNPNE